LLVRKHFNEKAKLAMEEMVRDIRVEFDTILSQIGWMDEKTRKRAKVTDHKVLTYIEYRAVSGVFRTIDPTTPLHPASVSSPRTKDGGGGGGTHSPGGEGVGGQYSISEDARHWIDVLQYNLFK
jgi:hypothetical protein